MGRSTFVINSRYSYIVIDNLAVSAQGFRRSVGNSHQNVRNGRNSITPYAVMHVIEPTHVTWSPGGKARLEGLTLAASGDDLIFLPSGGQPIWFGNPGLVVPSLRSQPGSKPTLTLYLHSPSLLQQRTPTPATPNDPRPTTSIAPNDFTRNNAAFGQSP